MERQVSCSQGKKRGSACDISPGQPATPAGGRPMKLNFFQPWVVQGWGKFTIASFLAMATTPTLRPRTPLSANRARYQVVRSLVG